MGILTPHLLTQHFGKTVDSVYQSKSIHAASQSRRRVILLAPEGHLLLILSD